MMLELVPSFQNSRVHLFHRNAQLCAEPVHDIPLPRVVLGVHPRLDLFVVDDAHPEALLRLRRVERRPGLLDLGEQLLPVRERVSEAVEHVFGFEVPERLELQPLGHVLLQLLDLVLDQRKWMLEGVIGKPCKLRDVSQGGHRAPLDCLLPMKCTSFPIPWRSASAIRFRTSNSEFGAVDKQRLERSSQMPFQAALYIPPPHLSNRAAV